MITLLKLQKREIKRSIDGRQPEVSIPGRKSLSGFTGAGYDKGRGVPAQIAWYGISGLLISHWWCPNRIRIAVLKIFGAQIGSGTLIRHRVRIHWPWKLVVGDNSWVGEGVWILNLEPVIIGDDVCISQDVLLCTGSHDRHSQTFEFDNAPITVKHGAWIAARATILRGVEIGEDAVVGATCLVTSDVPSGALVRAPSATVG
jgi:putative colanic acid biosynthesis acetyltransferase WcaF